MPPNPASRDAAARLHRQAATAGWVGRPVRAAGLLRRALAVLGPAAEDDAGLLVRLLVGLSRAETEQGRWEPACDLLTRAASAAQSSGDGVRGLVRAQRGVLLLHRGRVADAVAELDTAIRLLSDEPHELPAALLHRGAAYLTQHRLSYAAADFDRCIRCIREHSQEHSRKRKRVRGRESADVPQAAVVAGMVRHHRGYLALLTGDLPTAIREMTAARAELVRIDPGLAVLGVTHRARAQQAAGLLRAADADLAAAAMVVRARRRPYDLAEIELARAEVAVLDGRAADARRWARAAGRRLRRAGAQTRAAHADLLAVQAAQLLGTAPARVTAAAGTLADQLQQAGLAEQAEVARLVAARAALAAGQPSAAAGLVTTPPGLVTTPPELVPVPSRRPGRVSTRLLTRLVQAELAAQPGARTAVLRAGLRELHRHQSRFGGLDLCPVSVVHGRRLAELGLADALADGRPSVVLAWSERWRELATWLPPRRPSTEAAVHRPVRLGELRTALDDGLLVTYLPLGGRLQALVITRRYAQLVVLGDLVSIAADVCRVRADLDVLALGVLPERLRAAARASLQTGLRRLDAALWWPLPDPGEVPVVVVPTGVLAAVPWTSLPGIRCRPVTVAPSATWWVQARGVVPAQGRPVCVAGPGLARADTEARLTAAAWPAATVLTADRATPSAVLAAAAHSPLLHIAARGAHEPNSPLFSALDLVGGPLFGHQLAAATLPPQVVLSACDLGAVTAHPGNGPPGGGTRCGETSGGDTLGVTAALLHGGATSVVSGVARLGDAVGCEVTLAYHCELRAGRSPSAALARALAAAEADRAVDGARSDPAPLVCFGAGW